MFFINVAVSSLLRMSPLRLLYLPFLLFAFSCTPQGVHRLRISACAPLCSIRAALHKATADSSHSEASFEITSARDFIVMSLLLGFEYFCNLMSGSFLFGGCSVALLCSLLCSLLCVWRMLHSRIHAFVARMLKLESLNVTYEEMR